MSIPANASPRAVRSKAGSALSRRDVLGATVATGSLLAGHRVLAQVATSDLVRPFRIAVPQSDLDELRIKLDLTRWPDRETVSDRSQGVRLSRMQALVDHWRHRYDWRAVEREVNRHPQFKTAFDGVDIHFLHIRSRHAEALPMIMTHGWPGSFMEFMKVIGPLTDPTAHGGTADQAFHLVIPSLPGFGFSGKPTRPGWDHERTAHVWAQLMGRLGYDRYVAQGGDWGAIVTTLMARDEVQGLAGIHLNFPLVMPAQLSATPTAEEQAAVDALAIYNETRSGYFKQQATKPQTIGYGLADSPVGQAAWMYDHYVDATQSGGEPETVLTRDEILSEIMVYWLTNSGTSAARTYWENADFSFTGIPIRLPVGISVFPGEVYLPPRAWGEATYSNLIHWGTPARGGHFAALEQPDLFVNELRLTFASLRNA